MVAESDISTDLDPEIDSRRIIPVNPPDDSCFNLIHSWPAKCSEHDNYPKAAKVILPKRIIEVSRDPTTTPRLCLLNGDMGTYVVLTHCWGGSDIRKLTFSQIASFQEAIDVDSLPRTSSRCKVICHFLDLCCRCRIRTSA